jgi:diguanylate cyclase
MADNEIDQVTEWKQKYSQLQTKFDRQQSYDSILERSLGRLALAAQGLDDNLDNHLKKLRKVLRNNKTDQIEIESILKKMEHAIGQMEESQQATADVDIAQVLMDLVEALSLTGQFKKQRKQLLKDLRSAKHADMSALMEEVIKLINTALSEKLDQPSKSGFNLFGLLSKNDKTEQTEENIIDLELATNDNTPPHIVLVEMLEKLSLPEEQCKKMLKLRQHIEGGISPDALPDIIDQFATIVSSLSMKLLTEKREYETYLKSVSGQLSSLDESLMQASEAGKKAFENQNAIGQQVEDEMAGLRSHINKANSLEQLKSAVTTRLTFLSTHIENYRSSDKTHFDESQQQIQQLTNRIHEMEKQSEQLQQDVEKHRELALKDALTGMWNRQALNEELEKEFARWQRYQTPFSLVVWDIDFFKKVNDKYGHAAGDKVLKTFANTFMKATRDTDFVARFGGEEFVGIFPETKLNDALTLANKIREKVANSKFHYQGEPVPITASAGIAAINEDDTIDSLLQRADKMLYTAKSKGRNCCIG